MSATRSAGTAVAFGAACAFMGAALGVTLAAGAVAHADDDSWAVPVPPYQMSVLIPPGVEVGPPVNGDQDYNYYVHDPSGPPGNDDILAGTYVVHESGSAFGGPGVGALDVSSSSEDVISSTGGAPPVGTVWDEASATQTFPNWLVPYEPLTVIYYQDSSVTTASGATASIDTFFGSTNEYYSGPAGTFDYFSFGGGTPIALIDDPATASSAAATDAGTLWSDLGALF